MALISTNCKDIALYLTEYQRGQLSIQEFKEVDEHLSNCHRCTKENEVFQNLSLELDKIIPSVSKVYEQEFVYNLFIKIQKESIIVKILSLTLITSLIFFIFSGNFSAKKDYASIKDLKVRSENMFKEDFYSGKKTIE